MSVTFLLLRKQCVAFIACSVLPFLKYMLFFCGNLDCRHLLCFCTITQNKSMKTKVSAILLNEDEKTDWEAETLSWLQPESPL